MTPAAEVLYGAEEIAEALFGPPTTADQKRRNRRRVYLFIENRIGFPVFKIGSTICARRSSLVEWLADQERAAVAPAPAHGPDA